MRNNVKWYETRGMRLIAPKATEVGAATVANASMARNLESIASSLYALAMTAPEILLQLRRSADLAEAGRDAIDALSQTVGDAATPRRD